MYKKTTKHLKNSWKKTHKTCKEKRASTYEWFKTKQEIRARRGYRQFTSKPRDYKTKAMIAFIDDIGCIYKSDGVIFTHNAKGLFDRALMTDKEWRVMHKTFQLSRGYLPLTPRHFRNGYLYFSSNLIVGV